jgi:hypothetical protein
MNTLKPLLSWAETSLETSVNQPTLPHAIIALNGTDLSSDPEVWNSKDATKSILRANNYCIDPQLGTRYFIDLAERWRQKGKRIKKVLDLILCYYSTFKVIRIPHKGRYQLLHDQIHGLHGMISTACRDSFDAKANANMLSKSHELNIYFQCAFDHFAAKLNEPFNFIKVSLLNNPIPADFGGHILQLAIAMQSQVKSTGAVWIFNTMVRLLASCVVFDCIQHRTGEATTLCKTNR